MTYSFWENCLNSHQKSPKSPHGGISPSPGNESCRGSNSTWKTGIISFIWFANRFAIWREKPYFWTFSRENSVITNKYHNLTGKKSNFLPEHWSAALRSGAVLPERGRSAAPGSWPGALSERRSGKRPERTWSASAPTALQQTGKFIRYTTKNFALRAAFLISIIMKN